MQSMPSPITVQPVIAVEPVCQGVERPGIVQCPGLEAAVLETEPPVPVWKRWPVPTRAGCLRMTDYPGTVWSQILLPAMLGGNVSQRKRTQQQHRDQR